MSCDLSATLEPTRRPDPELVDLIEQAYPEAQIDGQKADFAFLHIGATGCSWRPEFLLAIT